MTPEQRGALLQALHLGPGVDLAGDPSDDELIQAATKTLELWNSGKVVQCPCGLLASRGHLCADGHDPSVLAWLKKNLRGWVRKNGVVDGDYISIEDMNAEARTAGLRPSSLRKRASVKRDLVRQIKELEDYAQPGG